jgi:hypothetical protein
MVNGIASGMSGQTYMYPGNVAGATQTTRDIAGNCFDCQRSYIQATQDFYKSDNNYKWPIIGTIASAIALILVAKFR